MNWHSWLASSEWRVAPSAVACCGMLWCCGMWSSLSSGGLLGFSCDGRLQDHWDGGCLVHVGTGRCLKILKAFSHVTPQKSWEIHSQFQNWNPKKSLYVFQNFQRNDQSKHEAWQLFYVWKTLELRIWFGTTSRGRRYRLLQVHSFHVYEKSEENTIVEQALQECFHKSKRTHGPCLLNLQALKCWKVLHGYKVVLCTGRLHKVQGKK